MHIRRTTLFLVAAAVLASLTPPGRPRLAPAAVPATRPAAGDRPAAVDRPATVRQKTQTLADKWKERFEAEHFSTVVAPPFVIAGDGTPAQLAAYRDGTVLAAERALRAQFFATPLEEPVLILLFESAEPYRRLAKAWFDEDDVPHFGFYQHADHAMLMNVSTGTGTLVHELTHALIAPDFPGVPDWFNEGLASLYEQCRFGPLADAARGGAIRGETNWRLQALQAAIRAGTLRPIPEMVADPDFRNADRVGLNYAHARYLMHYLQEKKLLRRYYADFRAAHAADPTGVDTLKKVVAPQSIEAFEKDWRAWVLTLRFGR
jgi:hypothetical protein